MNPNPSDSIHPTDHPPDPLPNADASSPELPRVPEASPVRQIYRHTLPVRLAHWINVLCLPILVMSGLQIFNAHPALYFGNRSDRDRAVFAIRSGTDAAGVARGVTTFFGWAFDTTGWLGVSFDAMGEPRYRGFPTWATIPSGQWLAMGRRWHFFFGWIFVVNGLLFGLYSLASRHLVRDLLPTWHEIHDIGRTVRDHLRLRHPTGPEATRYNVLQKIAYTGVVFVLGPLIVLTGLSMSPNVNALAPGLLTLFGGRQSARTIHFIACFAFIGYVVAHVSMVILTGFWNNLRSMWSGWYRV